MKSPSPRAEPLLRAPLPAAASSAVAEPTGELAVRGDWELGAMLSEGRWAKVYAARPTPAGVPAAWDYAVKTPAAKPGEGKLAEAMLRREATVARQVSHGNLTTVLHSQFEQGRGSAFLVLPRIRGVSVRELLDYRRRAFGCLAGASKFLRQSVWIARQGAQGLAALHAGGWLHGDLKPENMLVSLPGHLTLIDLGLARKLGTAECRGGEILAQMLRYVSPEMLLPYETVTQASDVYSLGMVLHELLTGQFAFVESDATGLALAHLRRQPEDLRELCPYLPPQLPRLLEKMLAKEPLRRPEAASVVRQLTRIEMELLAEG